MQHKPPLSTSRSINFHMALRQTVLRLTRTKMGVSQIIGTPLPKFDRFPYGAARALRLYRSFWRLIYRHPPEERNELGQRLRNEFRSKGNLRSKKQVAKAIKEAHFLLDHYSEMFQGRAVREAGVTSRRRGASAAGSDAFWEQFKMKAGFTVPGLQQPNSKVTSRPYVRDSCLGGQSGGGTPPSR